MVFLLYSVTLYTAFGANALWFLLHCLRSNALNSSEPPVGFSDIVFIASMMSSPVILMSESIFAGECPKKSFGHLVVLVWYRVLKTH